MAHRESGLPDFGARVQALRLTHLADNQLHAKTKADRTLAAMQFSAASTHLLVDGHLHSGLDPIRKMVLRIPDNLRALHRADETARIATEDLYKFIYNYSLAPSSATNDSRASTKAFIRNFDGTQPWFLVYAVFSPADSAYYIGSTKRPLFEKRFAEHYAAGVKFKMSIHSRSTVDGRYSALYRRMARVGPHRFAITPILFATEASFRAAEYRLQRDQRPALNTSLDFLYMVSAEKRSFRDCILRHHSRQGRIDRLTTTTDVEVDANKNHTPTTTSRCIDLYFFAEPATGRVSNSLSGILRDALDRPRGTTSITVVWTSPPNPIPLQLDYEHLLAIFGKTQTRFVTPHSSGTTTIGSLPAILSSASVGAFHAESLINQPGALTGDKDILIQLALGPITSFQHLQLDHLYHLRDHLPLIEKESTASAADRKLTSMIFRRYHMRRPISMRLSVPYSPALRQPVLCRLIRTTLRSLRIDTQLCDLLLSKTRVIATRPVSIGDILVNNIAASKNFNPTKPPSCQCDTLRALMRNPPDQGFEGHLIAKATDLTDTARGLTMNLKAAVSSPIQQQMRRVAEALDGILPPLLHLDTPKEHREGYITVKGKDVCVYDAESTFVGRLERQALTRLYRRFTHTSGTTDQSAFRRGVVELLRRYSRTKRLTNSTHWAAPPELYDILLDAMDTPTEGFASPLNVHELTQVFFTPHTGDSVFGGSFDRFSTPDAWLRPGVENPPFKRTIMCKTVEWAVCAAYASTSTYHWLVLPAWEDGRPRAHLALLDSDPSIHTVIVFQSNTLRFRGPHTLGSGRVTEAAQWDTILALVAAPDALRRDVALGRAIDRLQTYAATMGAIFTKPIPRDLRDDIHWPSCWRETPTATAPTPLRFDPTVRGEPMFSLDWEAHRHKTALQSCFTPELESRHEYLLSTVKETKLLTSGLVIAPLDHNTCAAVACCPVFYHDALERSFVRDPEHYERLDTTARRVVTAWRDFYEEHRLARFQHWPFNSGIPEPYILPKNKDILRYRPITPYTNHPLSASLNIASRALAFVMRQSGLRSFTLHEPADLKRLVQAANKQLQDNPRLRVFPRCGDVKNMYTELPHDALFSAIDWVLDAFHRHLGTDAITVKRKGPGGVVGGRRKRAGWVILCLEELRTLLRFDITNAIFTLGGGIYRQVKGIPMGSPDSPPLSNLVCMYSEEPFLRARLQTLLQEAGASPKDSVLTGRFFDDTTAFVLVEMADMSDSELDRAEKVADHVWGEMATLYHEDMVMEPTDCSSGVFKDLSFDVIITHDRRGIELRAHNPNTAWAIAGEPVARTRFPAMPAPSSALHKKSTVMTMLLSTKRLATTPNHFTSSAAVLLAEFSRLGYSYSFLLGAVKSCKIRHRCPRRLWDKVINYLKKMAKATVRLRMANPHLQF